jgi:hypothetical protein
LVKTSLFFVDKDTGEAKQLSLRESATNALALRRIALGFPIADIPVVR